MRKAALVVTVLLLGAPAFAATTLSEADRKFLGDAVAHQLAEARLGQLAVERGLDPEVKAFGRRILDDHARIDRELRKLAYDKNLELPTEMLPKDRNDYERLSNLSGPLFDRQFLKVMDARKEDAIDDFETEAGLGSDPDVRGWAMREVTVLRAQHDLAREDRQRL